MRKFIWLALCLPLALPASGQTLAQYAQPSYGQGQMPYQQQYQASPYGQHGAGQYPQQQQSAQTDPSVPGQSSLPAGQYELINLGTGQKRFITVTAQGQMYEQDPPAVGANVQQAQGYPGGYPQQGYAPQMSQAAGNVAPGQTGQPPIVGSALRGALGQYYNYKYGAPGSYAGSQAGMPGAGAPMGGSGGGYGYSTPGGAPGAAGSF